MWEKYYLLKKVILHLYMYMVDWNDILYSNLIRKVLIGFGQSHKKCHAIYSGFANLIRNVLLVGFGQSHKNAMLYTVDLPIS